MSPVYVSALKMHPSTNNEQCIMLKIISTLFVPDVTKEDCAHIL